MTEKNSLCCIVCLDVTTECVLNVVFFKALIFVQRMKSNMELWVCQSLNQVVLWDKIVLRGENTKLNLRDMKSKYFFFDDGNGLR